MAGSNQTTRRYGTHAWQPEVQADWSRGMIRDTATTAIPEGGLFDAGDFLLHQPGLAQKRGGTSYAGPAMTGALYCSSVIHAPFTAGAQLVALGSNGHLFTVTAGTTTDVGAISTSMFGRMCISPGGTYVVIPYQTANAQKYDGTTISTLAGGMGLNHVASYKSRLVGSLTATPNRLVFSNTPDVNSTWDTSNSYIDCDNQVSGLAALNNSLLIFSTDHMERIIGATPPGTATGSDMDRAPISPIGCTDCRSIVQVGQDVYFANRQGVWLTNGSTPVNLIEQGGMSEYWRELLRGYVAAAPVPLATGANWVISCGYWMGHLFVCVLNDSRTWQGALMCNLARRAWWRLTNMEALAWATALDSNTIYYADSTTNRVTTLVDLFRPTNAVRNDANGNAVTPTMTTAPFGAGPGIKSYGFGHLDYKMAGSSTNPTLGIGLNNEIVTEDGAFANPFTPAESPFAETTTHFARKRFKIGRDGQACYVNITQALASDNTEIYAVEVEQRPQATTGDGIS